MLHECKKRIGDVLSGKNGKFTVPVLVKDAPRLRVKCDPRATDAGNIVLWMSKEHNRDASGDFSWILHSRKLLRGAQDVDEHAMID